MSKTDHARSLHFRWTEQWGLRAWSVLFILREYLTVPERVEQRETVAGTVTQTSAAASVADSEDTANLTATPNTNFEKLLAKVNDWLK